MKIRTLNIAIILPTVISKNGTAKQSLELAKVLRDRGHNVSFFTFAFNQKSTFEDFAGFYIYYCKNLNNSIIYKFIKNISYLETIYLYLSLIFINRFRKLIEAKEIDLYNPHDWMGLWVVTGISKKKTIVANINDVPQRNKGLINKIKLYRDRKYKNEISKILVLDNMNKEKVLKWLCVRKNVVAVVRSGIDNKLYKGFNKNIDLRKEFGLNRNDTILVCANLLAPNRRYEDVLYMLSKFKKKGIKPHLVILSKLDFSPSYALFLKKIISKNNLSEQVHFVDKFFTNEERMTYIKSSDVLIFPNFPQTWGLTVLEAMSLGVPTIVSTGSGVSEVLHDGLDSYIYEKGDVDGLYKKVSVYLENKSKVKSVAERGKQYALKNFSWQKYGVEVEKVMLKSLRSKKYYVE